jgi:DNA mismatch endonuclease (patch repair protein)
MDSFDQATRSRVMGRIKSRGTKTTEWRFRSLLMRSGIRGWKTGHNSGLPGRPDVVFSATRLAVFVDGCFWHGCRFCRSIPTSNRKFWKTKIERNVQRDRHVAGELADIGWGVIRIWEHELKTDCEAVRRRVSDYLCKFDPAPTDAGSRLAPKRPLVRTH